MLVKVDGVEYPLPELDDLDMDECILLERVAGVGIEQLGPGESTPLGAVKALVMIAVMRANPDTKAKDLEPMIGRIKIKDLGEMFDSGDASPPVTPPDPERYTGTSGDDSTPGSDATPPTTDRNGSGTADLATTPISGPATSAP